MISSCSFEGGAGRVAIKIQSGLRGSPEDPTSEVSSIRSAIENSTAQLQTSPTSPINASDLGLGWVAEDGNTAHFSCATSLDDLGNKPFIETQYEVFPEDRRDMEPADMANLAVLLAGYVCTGQELPGIDQAAG